MLGILGSPGDATTGIATASQLNAITDITTPLSSFLNDPNRDDASCPQRPKAFINYIFFDEQFKMVSGGTSPVHPTGFTKDHFSDLQNLAATKNGYLYVYVSNESPVSSLCRHSAFFDIPNLRDPIGSSGRGSMMVAVWNGWTMGRACMIIKWEDGMYKTQCLKFQEGGVRTILLLITRNDL